MFYVVKLCHRKVSFLSSRRRVVTTTKSTIDRSKLASLECWDIEKIKTTCFPTFVLEFKIFIKKLPSALTNPDNQLGSLIFMVGTIVRPLGFTSGKAWLKVIGRPKLMEAFILTI